MRSMLAMPSVYRWFQESFGFSDSRRLAFERWLRFEPGMTIIDIGCGPGHILEHIPTDVRYTGFDTSDSYIAQARTKYGDRAEFHAQPFTVETAKQFGGADVVMLNGVLHHMDDAIASSCLQAAHAALREGGRLFTLDGCYIPSQNWIAKKLLDLDRGEYVRDQQAYERLISESFGKYDLHLTEELSKIPYTWLVMVGYRSAAN